MGITDNSVKSWCVLPLRDTLLVKSWRVGHEDNTQSPSTVKSVKREVPARPQQSLHSTCLPCRWGLTQTSVLLRCAVVGNIEIVIFKM